MSTLDLLNQSPKDDQGRLQKIWLPFAFLASRGETQTVTDTPDTSVSNIEENAVDKDPELEKMAGEVFAMVDKIGGILQKIINKSEAPTVEEASVGKETSTEDEQKRKQGLISVTFTCSLDHRQMQSCAKLLDTIIGDEAAFWEKMLKAFRKMAKNYDPEDITDCGIPFEESITINSFTFGRSLEKNKLVMGVSCFAEWECEHGLGILFGTNGKVVEVGYEDIVFCMNEDGDGSSETEVEWDVFQAELCKLAEEIPRFPAPNKSFSQNLDISVFPEIMERSTIFSLQMTSIQVKAALGIMRGYSLIAVSLMIKDLENFCERHAITSEITRLILRTCGQLTKYGFPVDTYDSSPIIQGEIQVHSIVDFCALPILGATLRNILITAKFMLQQKGAEAVLTLGSAVIPYQQFAKQNECATSELEKASHELWKLIEEMKKDPVLVKCTAFGRG